MVKNLIETRRIWYQNDRRDLRNPNLQRFVSFRKGITEVIFRPLHLVIAKSANMTDEQANLFLEMLQEQGMALNLGITGFIESTLESEKIESQEKGRLQLECW